MHAALTMDVFSHEALYILIDCLKRENDGGFDSRNIRYGWTWNALILLICQQKLNVTIKAMITACDCSDYSLRVMFGSLSIKKWHYLKCGWIQTGVTMGWAKKKSGKQKD